MRLDVNVFWLVSPADAAVVAAAYSDPQTLEQLARVAAVLAHHYPAAAAASQAELPEDATPEVRVRACVEAARAVASRVRAEGETAAARFGLPLGSISSSPRLVALLQAEGGSVPGLLIQPVSHHDLDTHVAEVDAHLARHDHRADPDRGTVLRHERERLHGYREHERALVGLRAQGAHVHVHRAALWRLLGPTT